jgi:hypothetical protein
MSHSDAFVNQVTLDCLLNKELFGRHVKNKRANSNNKEERKFYKKRIFNLFKDIITGNEPTDLLPDVKYAYDNFLNSCIHFFKTIDKNDAIQSEYNDYNDKKELSNVATNLEENLTMTESNESIFSKNEADKILMRSIQFDAHTLDKYVKKTSTKKKETIILPKQKNINLQDPEFKNKGLKKKNINNKYEDNSKKETE